MEAVKVFVLTVIVFGVLIFVHELGHFLACRIFGVKVNEFAIGMGPKLVSVKGKKSSTVYSIRALPIGGFNNIEEEIPGQRENAGEEDRDRTSPEYDKYQHESLLRAWKHIEDHLTGKKIFERLCRAIVRAVKGNKFNQEIPFKLPYRLWELEAYLAPLKDFWQEKGVSFRTERSHDATKDHIIYFKIEYPGWDAIVQEIEALPDSSSDSDKDEWD